MKWRQFITVKIPEKNESIDFEVPGEKTFGEILPILLKWLSLPEININDGCPYALWDEHGKKIDLRTNYVQPKMKNFKVLILDSKSPVSTSQAKHQINDTQLHENQRPFREFRSFG